VGGASRIGGRGDKKEGEKWTRQQDHQLIFLIDHQPRGNHQNLHSKPSRTEKMIGYKKTEHQTYRSQHFGVGIWEKGAT